MEMMLEFEMALRSEGMKDQQLEVLWKTEWVLLMVSLKVTMMEIRWDQAKVLTRALVMVQM